jgi:hypothetical protein
MNKRKSCGGLLIVVELGADWPTLAELGERAAGRRVLAQEEGETPGQFAARVASQVDRLFGRGVLLTTAVVACNERLDPNAARARAELARTALGIMAKRTGTLLLSASERSSGRLRHALSSLAAELTREWQRAEVVASVHFGEDPAGPASADVPVRVSARRSKDSNRRVA